MKAHLRVLWVMFKLHVTTLVDVYDGIGDFRLRRQFLKALRAGYSIHLESARHGLL